MEFRPEGRKTRVGATLAVVPILRTRFLSDTAYGIPGVGNAVLGVPATEGGHLVSIAGAYHLRNAGDGVPYNMDQTTSVHFFGNAVGVSRGFSHFCSQMTPSQRPILKPQFSNVE